MLVHNLKSLHIKIRFHLEEIKTNFEQFKQKLKLNQSLPWFGIFRLKNALFLGLWNDYRKNQIVVYYKFDKKNNECFLRKAKILYPFSQKIFRDELPQNYVVPFRKDARLFD